jgi:hypothetical protein
MGKVDEPRPQRQTTTNVAYDLRQHDCLRNVLSTRTSATSIWGAQGPQDRSRGAWSLATWALT